MQNGNLIKNVIDHFKNQFLEGKVKPGELLPSERDLAEQLGVSRTTIREAIITLKVMGLVEISRGKRAQIRNPSLDSVLEILSLATPLDQEKTIALLELREIFEPPCVGLATRRATTQELKEINKSLDDMSRSANDPDGFFNADYEFHRKIMLATHNDMIEIFYTIFQPLLKNLARITFINKQREYADFKETTKKHEAILQALANGDAEAAMEYSRKLLAATKKRYLESIFTVHEESK